MALEKITEQEREILKQKSAQSLPDVPSLQNWSPKQFKNAITKVLFDNKDSFYAYINRIVDAINNGFVTATEEKVDLITEPYASITDFAVDVIKRSKEVGVPKIYLGALTSESTTDRKTVVGICQNISSGDTVLVFDSVGAITLYNGSLQSPIQFQNISSPTFSFTNGSIANLTITGNLNALNASVGVKEPTVNSHPTTKKYVDDIKTALEDLVSKTVEEAKVTVDNTVTSTSENPVKSKGIHTFVESEINKEVANRENSINAAKTELNTNISNATTKARLKETLGLASNTNDGLLSATDYTTLMNLVNLLNTDESNYVDTINEILHIFEEYPEGANIYEILNSKAEKTDVDDLKEKVENLETSGEDVTYTNYTPTSAALGGIAKGTTFENKTIKEMFDMLLYPYVAFTASFSTNPNGGTYEVGTSVTVNTASVTISFGSKEVTDIGIYDGDTEIASKTSNIGNSNSFTINQTVTSNKSFTAKVTDGTTTKTLSSGTFRFVYAMYNGVLNSGYSLTEAVVKGQNKNVVAKATQSITYTMSNQYAFFAYPSSYGVLGMIKDQNNFDVTETFTRNTVTVNGVSYYVYVLNSANTATMTYTFSW